MSERTMSVEYGERRVVIDCPHIEGGACGPCVAAAISPMVAALDALAYVMKALPALEAVLVQAAGGTSKLIGNLDTLAKREWKVEPDAGKERTP